MRKYYEANPKAIKNKHLLALHEGLHAAACEALGLIWQNIKLNKTTGTLNWDRLKLGTAKWKEAAIDLAPAIIDDMSDSDQDSTKLYPARTRGYAWGWINRNREALLLRANEIAAATDGRGVLLNKEGKLVWKPRRDK